MNGIQGSLKGNQFNAQIVSLPRGKQQERKLKKEHDMCNGLILFNGCGCPYEIKGGPNWGDCEKPNGAVCPDSIPEQGDDYEEE
jgi:hypothetical protein